MVKFKDIWDRSKDGRKREQRSFIRFAIIATAAFALFMLLKKDSLVHWVEAGFTLRRQERQIEALIRDNDALDRRIHDLSSNRDSLERFARETFYFAAPGEDVYIEQ